MVQGVALTALLTKEMAVGVLLILPGESAVADMVEVLEPLKI